MSLTVPAPGSAPLAAPPPPLAAPAAAHLPGLRWKRALDLALALPALPLAASLVALAGCAVALDSPGPPLFRQVRVGRGGRPIVVWKLRTMERDAEARAHAVVHLNQCGGPFFKAARDPRVTRVGAWLRRTSLDELPQLWNVVRGDMSLVGPRPMLPREAAALGLPAPSLRPGVTGLWQVEARKRPELFDRRVELDREYESRASLALDLRLLASTCRVVFGRRNC